MSSELGQIDEPATIRAFDKLRPSFMLCYGAGQSHIEFLAGDVKFYFRVKPDGTTHWATLDMSTLGDRDTEKCMLAVVLGAQWPKPEGGEAEVHQGIGFDAPGDVRAPTVWSAEPMRSTR